MNAPKWSAMNESNYVATFGTGVKERRVAENAEYQNSQITKPPETWIAPILVSYIWMTSSRHSARMLAQTNFLYLLLLFRRFSRSRHREKEGRKEGRKGRKEGGQNGANKASRVESGRVCLTDWLTSWGAGSKERNVQNPLTTTRYVAFCIIGRFWRRHFCT
jgi:hypothetical protein